MAYSKEQLKGSGLVLLAGVSWGVISLFIRHLNALGLSSMDVAALRSIFAGIVLVIVLALLRKGKAFKIKLRDSWCLAGCGIASITMFNILYFATMRRTTVGVAVILLYTSPIFVTLLSCLFFKERFTIGKLISLIMVMVGCVFVSGVLSSGQADKLSLPVLLMGIGSGLCYGLFSIFGRFAQQRGYSSEAITLWSFIFSGIALSFFLDYHNAWHTMMSGHLALNCAMLLGLVCIATILPYFTYTAGLKKLQPSTAAIIAAVEPIVGSLVGILVFSETMNWSVGIGMLFIISAMLITR